MVRTRSGVALIIDHRNDEPVSIADEKYLALETFRKNGEAKSTPVWIADLGDGTIGFTTASSSWKVKRLRNDPRVTLQPSDSRGNPTAGTDVVTGTAQIAQGAEFERVKAVTKKKYGLQFTMISFVGKLAKLVGRGSGTDTAIIITLD